MEGFVAVYRRCVGTFMIGDHMSLGHVPGYSRWDGLEMEWITWRQQLTLRECIGLCRLDHSDVQCYCSGLGQQSLSSQTRHIPMTAM